MALAAQTKERKPKVGLCTVCTRKYTYANAIVLRLSLEIVHSCFGLMMLLCADHNLLFQRMGTTNRKLKWTASQQTQSVVWGRPKAVGKMKICLIEGQFKVISGLKLVTNCEWVTAAGGIWVSEKKERKGHWKEERRRKREERRGVARATRLSSTPRAAGDLRTPS